MQNLVVDGLEKSPPKRKPRRRRRLPQRVRRTVAEGVTGPRQVTLDPTTTAIGAEATAAAEAVSPASRLIRLATAAQAARLAALQTEIRLLGDASLGCQLHPVRNWRARAFSGVAPFAVVRDTRAARFRLPRELKTELLDRFCGMADTDDAAPPTSMVIVAHQDDESIGAGARLCHLTHAYIVHVTDGAPRAPEVARRYGFESREAYAEARQRELRNALRLIGMPLENVLSLGYVDGEASLRLVDLCLRVAELLDTYRPDVVITHPYEGGHTDHDATAFAVHLACGILRRDGLHPPAVLEIASYNAAAGARTTQEFLPHDGADKDRRMILLGNDEQDLKQKMFGCFTTQQTVLSTFSTAFEQFRPAPRYQFTRPPHAGQLNYERYGDPHRGERWRREADVALQQLRVRR